MDRPLILYLHGFCSSPASLKSRQFAAAMNARGLGDRFVCPQLSPVPDEAVACASGLVEAADGPVTLVGSSLGGHYASHLAEKYGLKAVLINPAAVSSLDAAKFIGEHANFHTDERFTFTAAHAAQLEAQISKPTPARYWLLVETGDEVLDYCHAVVRYAGCRQSVLEGGDHSFTRWDDYLDPILQFAGLLP